MKTFFVLKSKHLRTVSLAVSFIISQQCVSQPDYNFGTGTLESGIYKQLNSVYRYSNVKTGIDGKVTIKALVNATIDSVDKNGIGHICAFQPSIYANANSVGYIEFEIQFVNTGTNTAVNQSEINVSSIDIDGSGPLVNPDYIIYEFDEYNFAGGATIDYNTLGGQLSYSTAGPWVRGINVNGVEYPDVDTSAKEVMFSMQALNQSTFLVRMGADNHDPLDRYRLRSLYFQKFTYPNSVLPVKLTSFTATLNSNSKVDLKWNTASEINVSHFVVEQSFDGASFIEAGLVFAYGNATDNTNYSFADNLDNTSATVIYYRLRSVDVDGKTEYSETRMIRIRKGNESTISILAFPNPAVNDLRITIPAAWQNKAVTYQVYSINGQVVNNKQTNNSSQTETINISTLAPGMYIVKATCGTETAQQRIVKQ